MASEPANPAISIEPVPSPARRREPLPGRLVRKGLHALGPGFITGASDDDPSGIATYSQTGAQYGYSLLWTAVWQIPLLYFTQEAVARIGAVRGKGLASAIREQYGMPVAVLLAGLVVVADTVNAGADIGAVAGSAHLVLPISVKLLIVLTTTLVLVSVVFVGYRRYANILKILSLFLMAYLVTVFVISPPWGEVLKSTFVPHIEFTTSFLFLLVGTFGTTITAYRWFWQSNQEVEEELADGMIGPEGKVDQQHLGPFLKRMRATPVYVGAMLLGIVISSAPPFIVEKIKKRSWVISRPDPVLVDQRDSAA